MSRWKYRTATVTVDENTVTVRGLTAGERKEFAEASKKSREAKEAGTPGASPLDVPRLVARCGVIDPKLTDEDIESMPGDLLDAVVLKVLELSGVKTDEAGEKKDPALH